MNCVYFYETALFSFKLTYLPRELQCCLTPRFELSSVYILRKIIKENISNLLKNECIGGFESWMCKK